MKKYRYAFPVSAYVIYALVVAVSAVSMVLASLRLAGVGGFLSVYPALDITSLVLSVLFIIALALIVFMASFGFKEDFFVIDRVFVRKKIARENLLKYVWDEKAGIGALYYTDENAPADIRFVVITIHKGKRKAFEESLRLFKSDILIESRTEE